MKSDTGKPQWHLLRGMLGALDDVLRVRAYGVEKYGDPDNWLTVTDGHRRYVDAACRHLSRVLDGEHIDPESGLPHLAHAACSVLFALAMGLKGVDTPSNTIEVRIWNKQPVINESTIGNREMTADELMNGKPVPHRPGNPYSDAYKECSTCAAKPGAPTLCSLCLMRRKHFGELERIWNKRELLVDREYEAYVMGGEHPPAAFGGGPMPSRDEFARRYIDSAYPRISDETGRPKP